MVQTGRTPVNNTINLNLKGDSNERKWNFYEGTYKEYFHPDDRLLRKSKIEPYRNKPEIKSFSQNNM